MTAPFRGPGLELLRQICDVELDPWIDHSPMRIWDGPKLAARIDELGATVLICEAGNNQFYNNIVANNPGTYASNNGGVVVGGYCSGSNTSSGPGLNHSVWAISSLSAATATTAKLRTRALMPSSTTANVGRIRREIRQRPSATSEAETPAAGRR